MSPFAAIQRRVGALTQRSLFARNVLLVGGGALGGQALLLLASPLLTRLYSAEAFGVLAIFTALLSILSVLASMRYEMAIPLPESDHDALLLVGVCLAGIAMAASIVTAAVVFVRIPIAAALGLDEGAAILWLLPLSVLGIGTYNTFYYWGVRRKAFQRIARTRIVQSAGSVAVQVGAGLLLPVPMALVAGQIVGQTLGIGSLSAGAEKEWLAAVRAEGVSGLARVARDQRRFPLFTMPAALINVSSAQLPTLLLTRLFGTAVAGWYSLAFRILLLPITLLGQAMATVFFADTSAVRDAAAIGRQARQVFRGLVTLAAGPMVLVGIAAPLLFSLIFGQQWHTSGQYAQVLMPWFFIVLVTSPLSSLVLTLGRQRGEMAFQVALLLTRVLSLLVGARIFASAYAAIALFALCSTAAWLVYLLWLMQIAQNGIKAPLIFLSSELARAALLAAPTLTALLLTSDSRIVLAVFAANALLIGYRVFSAVKGFSALKAVQEATP